jgi:hypothetical protein
VNLAPKNPPSMVLMKTALDAWLERVVYSRDTRFNQAASKTLTELVLPSAPKPQVTTQDQTLDDDRIEVLGFSVADKSPRPAPNTRIELEVYFKVKQRPQTSYRFLVSVWPVTTPAWKPTDAAPDTVQRTSLRATGDGFFPTERWRPGEYVRDKFSLSIPADWLGNGLAVGLVAADPNNEKPLATGAAPANDAKTMVLGVLPLGSTAANHP